MRRNDIYFLESDVNELAQAKGANVAGLQVVCSQYGIDFDEIDVFYLAGGFGRHLKVDASRRIGLIPESAGLASRAGGQRGHRRRVHRAALALQAPGIGRTGDAGGALPAGNAPVVLRFLRGWLPVQGGRIGESGGRMTEWIETHPEVEVQAAEYQRLLGYPPGYVMDGRARELADWATRVVRRTRASVDLCARGGQRRNGRRVGEH